ncbi:MAG: hypothetical protein ABH950_04885 [Candidatus Altiarchaeota archaeon]
MVDVFAFYCDCEWGVSLSALLIEQSSIFQLGKRGVGWTISRMKGAEWRRRWRSKRDQVREELMREKEED